MRNCKNCGKELPDNQWCCNDKCVREYYKKKGAGKKYSTDNFCKNCGKELPESLQFCSKDCLDEFKFLDYAEIVFVSAKHKESIHTIFPALNRAYENYQKQVQTSVINDLVNDAVAMNPTAIFNHGKAQFNYVTQVAIKPPTFVFLSIIQISYIFPI